MTLLRTLLCLLPLLLLAAMPARAQEFPLEPADTSSPRGTYESFLTLLKKAYTAGEANDRETSQQALDKALRLFDTSRLPPRFMRDRSIEAALLLKEVTDRLPALDPATIPGDDSLPYWRVPKTEITLARQTEGPRTGEYLFSAGTVARARADFKSVEHLPYVTSDTPGIYTLYLTTPGPGLAKDWSAIMPAWMEKTYAEQAIWQWLTAALVLLAAIVFSLGLIFLGASLDRRHRRGGVEAGTGRRRTSPALMLCLVGASLVLFLAQYVIDAIVNLTGVPLEVITYLLDAAGYVLVGWLLVLAVMNAAHIFIRLRGLDPDAASGRLIRLAASGASVFVVVGLFVQAGQAFGLPAYSIVTGLGVGGIAIGFGAQTLVRDIFSGIFFLVDDAFRPGEYIDTGVAKGFVERVSIRSVQLRHHNGPLQTIPFGEIKKVNNFSRDWVVMKIAFRLHFGTDTEYVRRLIKNLGKELLADPEYGAMFLEPLKSQGIYDVDDFGIIMRVKFMTRPGDQFVLKRMVNLKIQELFKQEGIEFAGREVKVHGDASRDLAGNASELISDDIKI